jgi:hypothetical protein
MTEEVIKKKLNMRQINTPENVDERTWEETGGTMG